MSYKLHDFEPTRAQKAEAAGWGMLKMTSDECAQFAAHVQSRRVIAEGMLLALQAETVKDGTVRTAHALVEAKNARRMPLSMQIGGRDAQPEQILAARQRLEVEVAELVALDEAAKHGAKRPKEPNMDLSMEKAGPHSNPRVVHLQNRLNSIGHRVLPDGIYGPMTEEAVKDFQTNAGLPASGVVDSLTSDSLRRGGRVATLNAPPGMAPGAQAVPSAPGFQQPAEKAAGDATAAAEKSKDDTQASPDASKSDPAPKTGAKKGKSVSVNVKLNEAEFAEAMLPLEESDDWMSGAVKHPGAFRAWLGKKPGEKVTAADIAKGKASPNKHVQRMARLAETFKHTQEAAEAEEPDMEEADKVAADLPMKKKKHYCPKCGAPVKGNGICLRGHAVGKDIKNEITEAWSAKARAAAAAARKGKGAPKMWSDTHPGQGGWAEQNQPVHLSPADREYGDAKIHSVAGQPIGMSQKQDDGSYKAWGLTQDAKGKPGEGSFDHDVGGSFKSHKEASGALLSHYRKVGSPGPKLQSYGSKGPSRDQMVANYRKMHGKDPSPAMLKKLGS
jgi:hypothetical protein